MILLRSAAFNAWFYGLTVVMALASVPVRLAAPGRAMGFARCWARMVLAGLRLTCGITWEVTGLQHLPGQGPALIASMHQSAFDALVWVVLQPRLVYVLKRELLRIPLFGGMLRHTGMIPVDRTGGAAALRALLRDADRALSEQRQIVIFPEGTRVAPGASVKLHPGIAAIAQRTGLPVIPVATDSGRHWGRRAFGKRPGVIHVAIQPPIPPGLPRAELLARLEATFRAGTAALAPPVDNSVGTRSRRLPQRASKPA